MNRMLVALSAICLPILSVAAPPITEPVDVNVTNPVLPVEVSNADPIPVTVSSLPPEERYQTARTWDDWGDPTSVHTSVRSFSGDWNIPADKILVIDYLSAEATANPGDKVHLQVTCQGAGFTVARIALPLNSVGKFGAYERMIGGGAVTCFTGSALIVNMLRDSDVPAGTIGAVTVSVVGHLVDRPQ